MADVADAEAVAALLAALDRRWSRVDLLVNNAGIGPVSSILDHPLAGMATGA